MDLKQVVLAACLLAVCSAQVPAYSCGGATNCNSGTYATRGDVMGCVYFCNLDADNNDLLTKTEFDTSFATCVAIDPSGTCTEASFVVLIKNVLPVCDQEAAAIYGDWSSRDGNAGLQQSDVDILWVQGGGNADGSGNVGPAGFEAEFSQTWAVAEAAQNPPCTLPYP